MSWSISRISDSFGPTWRGTKLSSPVFGVVRTVVVILASGARGAPVDAAEGGAAVGAIPQAIFEVKRAGFAHSLIIATRPVHWRLLHSPPLGGPDNMALDEALLRRARRTGETVLRVYGWSVPTLSLGRNQRARDQYDEAALARAGIE